MLTRKYRFIRPSRDHRELTLLTEIGKNAAITQRALGRAALLSVTMVNAYLDDLLSRGLVEVTGDTLRSYRYELTPLGQDRRNELFFLVSREIIQFYGQMKAEFQRRLREHYANGIRRVVLFGAAETGELVHAAGRGTGIEIVGIVDNDPAKVGREINGMTITSPDSVETLSPEAVIITSFGHMNEIYEQIRHLEDRGIRVLKL